MVSTGTSIMSAYYCHCDRQTIKLWCHPPWLWYLPAMLSQHHLPRLNQRYSMHSAHTQTRPSTLLIRQLLPSNNYIITLPTHSDQQYVACSTRWLQTSNGGGEIEYLWMHLCLNTSTHDMVLGMISGIFTPAINSRVRVLQETAPINNPTN